MRNLARFALGLAVVCQGSFMLLGILIPFTIGVSTVLMPIPLLGYVIAALVARYVRPRLEPADVLRPRIDAQLKLARYVGYGALGVLGLLLVSIGIGVIIGLLRRP